MGFTDGSEVKNLPAIQELQAMQVHSLGSGRSPGGGHLLVSLNYIFLSHENYVLSSGTVKKKRVSYSGSLPHIDNK